MRFRSFASALLLLLASATLPAQTAPERGQTVPSGGPQTTTYLGPSAALQAAPGGPLNEAPPVLRHIGNIHTFGVLTGGNYTADKDYVQQFTVSRATIKELWNSVLVCTGLGDCHIRYDYLSAHAGGGTGSDEGIANRHAQVWLPDTMASAASLSSGTGLTRIDLNETSATHPVQGDTDFGQWRKLFNTSQPVATCTLADYNGNAGTVTVDPASCRLPAGHGTIQLTGGLPAGWAQQPGQTVALPYKVLEGTGPRPGDPMCVADFDEGLTAAAGTTAGTVSAAWWHAVGPGTVLGVGQFCRGYTIAEWDRETAPHRELFPVWGVEDASTLQVRIQRNYQSTTWNPVLDRMKGLGKLKGAIITVYDTADVMRTIQTAQADSVHDAGTRTMHFTLGPNSMPVAKGDTVLQADEPGRFAAIEASLIHGNAAGSFSRVLDYSLSGTGFGFGERMQNSNPDDFYTTRPLVPPPPAHIIGGPWAVGIQSDRLFQGGAWTFGCPAAGCDKDQEFNLFTVQGLSNTLALRVNPTRMHWSAFPAMQGTTNNQQHDYVGYAGSLTTGGSGTDTMQVYGLTSASHCLLQQTAGNFLGAVVGYGQGVLTVRSAAGASAATYDVFCSVQ